MFAVSRPNESNYIFNYNIEDKQYSSKQIKKETLEGENVIKPHSLSFCSETKTNCTSEGIITNTEQSFKKKKKFRLRRKSSFLSEKALISFSTSHNTKVILNEEVKKRKHLTRGGDYNSGRWKPEEHKRFVEAIIKFGNEWKEVQKHVGTRSSTQARSHAQKFFVKIKKSNILDLNIDFSTNSVKILHDMANNMDSDKYVSAIQALNCIAFERKVEDKIKQRIKRRNSLNNEQ